MECILDVDGSQAFSILHLFCAKLLGLRQQSSSRTAFYCTARLAEDVRVYTFPRLFEYGNPKPILNNNRLVLPPTLSCSLKSGPIGISSESASNSIQLAEPANHAGPCPLLIIRTSPSLDFLCDSGAVRKDQVQQLDLAGQFGTCFAITCAPVQQDVCLSRP